jgi:DNA-binding beta-propeller fold protein YncE
VNPATNQFYVAHDSIKTITVIGGATNKVTTAAVGEGPHAVAVNPVTNKVYVANGGSATVTVFSAQ